ncbi:hypothetical protein L915_21966 [Phytophthora nicotianae]|uniref:Uncharacterized protein n=1 Tax=Phytophthora nicotianae TaxID=4792 RepID=W2P1Z0_PHYNI|nr:hypothetical protein L915_21966 [Phytophthora nicotianae]ETL48736.1 hypothetical protein L916_01689 [Phytophthora nicotianae]ETM55027.1 hypothetical protein L914_01710 [Phytophthora nicotianae]
MLHDGSVKMTAFLRVNREMWNAATFIGQDESTSPPVKYNSGSVNYEPTSEEEEESGSEEDAKTSKKPKASSPIRKVQHRVKKE